MGRKSRKKKERRHTSIDQHKRNGKILSPPFAQIENMKKLSWIDDRLPSFLWIGLIINLNDRLIGINYIHEICKYFHDKPEELRPEELTTESISEMSDKQIDKFYDFLFNELLLKEEIKPLLLFESFPKKHLLEKYISIESEKIEGEFNKLFNSVANMLDHQSQLATDCRWARIYYLMISGKLKMGPLKETIVNYPQEGDMRLVRPTIRSCEIAMSGMSKPSLWVKSFWEEALTISPCWNLNVITEQESDLKTLDIQNIDEVRIAIRELFLNQDLHQQSTQNMRQVLPLHYIV